MKIRYYILTACVIALLGSGCKAEKTEDQKTTAGQVQTAQSEAPARESTVPPEISADPAGDTENTGRFQYYGIYEKEIQGKTCYLQVHNPGDGNTLSFYEAEDDNESLSLVMELYCEEPEEKDRLEAGCDDFGIEVQGSVDSLTIRKTYGSFWKNAEKNKINISGEWKLVQDIDI